MRKNWTRMMLMVALAAVSLAGPTVGAAQTAGGDTIDVNFQGAPMRDAVRELIRLTGLSIVFESSAEEYPTVDLMLKDVRAEDALRYVCESVGVYLRKDENGVFIVSRTKPAAPAGGTDSVPTPAVKEKKKLYRIKLQKADPEAVFHQITTGQVFDQNSGFKEIKRFEELNNYGKPGVGTRNDRVFFPEQANTQSFTPLSTNNPKPINGLMETANGITLPNEASPQAGFGGGFGPGGGGGQGPGGGGGGQGPGGGGAGQGQGQGGSLSTGGLIPSGITYITWDPNDNSIIVLATEQEWRDMLRYVEEFDVAPRQVTIKVQFVTTTSSKAKSLGFDWLYTRGTMAVGNTPGTFARSSDPIFLSWQTGNVQTRLRTFLQDGYGNVVSTPSVRTLNNQPAIVSQGVQTVIFVPNTFIGQGGSITTYTPVPLTANSTLSVRPRINNDDTVTVFLSVPIQQLGQIRRAPDGTSFPDISFQFISMVARVRSGETIVLAGFTQKSDIGTQSKFPVLGDLPIIGQFFRSNTQDNNASELLVFVTPIIEPDEDH